MFHVTLLASAALGLLVTLVVSNMVRRSYPVPGWLLCLVRGRAGATVLCLAAAASSGSQHSIDSEGGCMKAHAEDLGASSLNSDVEALTPVISLDINTTMKSVKSMANAGSATAGHHHHHHHHHQQQHHHLLKRHDHGNWSLVTTFIDRVAFVVYIVIMAVIGVRYLVL